MESNKYSIMDHYFYPTIILATILILIVFACLSNIPKNNYLKGDDNVKQTNSQQEVSD